MEMKKCVRCGKFYASEVEVCPACEKKDNVELGKLRGFFKDNYASYKTGVTRMKISSATGIATKNLNRYLGYPEFSEIFIAEDANVGATVITNAKDNEIKESL